MNKVSSKMQSDDSFPLRQYLCLMALGLFITSASWLSFAQQTNTSTKVSSSYECTQVSLDDIDTELLTKEERLALMDASLSQSIDSYSSCVNTVQTAMTGGGGGGGGAAGQGSSGEGPSQSGSAQTPDSENAQSEPAQSVNMGSEVVNQQSNSQTPVNREVVAPKDNDSIICKLLFDEIQKSSGTARTGLEKQYKDYMCGS
jgi:hypothetical protein